MKMTLFYLRIDVVSRLITDFSSNSMHSKFWKLIFSGHVSRFLFLEGICDFDDEAVWHCSNPTPRKRPGSVPVQSSSISFSFSCGGWDYTSTSWRDQRSLNDIFSRLLHIRGRRSNRTVASLANQMERMVMGTVAGGMADWIRRENVSRVLSNSWFPDSLVIALSGLRLNKIQWTASQMLFISEASGHGSCALSHRVCLKSDQHFKLSRFERLKMKASKIRLILGHCVRNNYSGQMLAYVIKSAVPLKTSCYLPMIIFAVVRVALS